MKRGIENGLIQAGLGAAVWISLVGGSTAGCSKANDAPAPEPPHATPPPEPAPEPVPTAEPTPPPPEPATTEPTAPEPPPLRGANLCESICVKMDASCKERAAQICRANCEDYVRAEAQCPVEVERALECQTNADDLILCSNMAAESCVKHFGRLKDCRAGKITPEPRAAGTSVATSSPPIAEEIPAGFRREESSELGISLLLPEPTEVKTTGSVVRLAAQKQGVEFFAENIPGAHVKPTDRSILKTALDYLGLPCQTALKLHGRYETGDVIHVRFDTKCKDGVVWRGAFHFWNDKSVVTALRSTSAAAMKEAEADLEPFLFGFRVLGR